MFFWNFLNDHLLHLYEKNKSPFPFGNWKDTTLLTQSKLVGTQQVSGDPACTLGEKEGLGTEFMLPLSQSW